MPVLLQALRLGDPSLERAALSTLGVLAQDAAVSLADHVATLVPACLSLLTSPAPVRATPASRRMHTRTHAHAEVQAHAQTHSRLARTHAHDLIPDAYIPTPRVCAWRVLFLSPSLTE
jgi:hypothetical protein